MKVLVTGSRNWTDRAVIVAALKTCGATVVVHGAQATRDDRGIPIAGADWHAAEATKELGIVQLPYPAKWREFGRSAGPRRNQQMLDENPDVALVLAFPLPDSKGTWDMCERADKAGIEVKALGDSGIRRRDTPENRAYWKSIQDVAQQWRASRPEWSREVFR